MNRHATRIFTGSVILTRRIRTGLATWIAGGRRTDLSGWRAALGPLVRTGIVLALGYAAVRIIRAAPVLLWLLTPAWLVAAYRHGAAPAAVQDEPEDADPAPAADPRTGFARWLLTLIGDRPGIHLYELYPAMRQLPGQEGRDDAALRAALRTLGVPIQRSLRVGTIQGRSGVRRADAEALLSPAESGTGERHGDAGQSEDSPSLSKPGERAESA
ncbi:hypothetical protein SAMN05216251_108233 [Actinacidiphila alni]|uniref:Uncharacterized protein n=1 Tax=Actinacidiphila alni TaxID=380248 RepID=A0A1I2G3Q8_9ACTN|nr:hypothetical protein [Actinacidiphila alni]SFF11769.1 hypothetical protein SAMN05216251_108233 [Actinacidiphila alni]